MLCAGFCWWWQKSTSYLISYNEIPSGRYCIWWIWGIEKGKKHKKCLWNSFKSNINSTRKMYGLFSTSITASAILQCNNNDSWWIFTLRGMIYILLSNKLKWKPHEHKNFVRIKWFRERFSRFSNCTKQHRVQKGKSWHFFSKTLPHLTVLMLSIWIPSI